MKSDADLSLDELIELERMDADAANEAANEGGRAHPSGDDVVVLPWWQHPFNIVTLVVTAAVLAGMIGWMIGDNAAGIEHNEVDTGFLQDMRAHHEQAVLMGVIYRNLPETDPGLRTVARSIVTGQSLEIGRMIQLLRMFGESEANETDTSMVWMGMASGVGSMPGMATDDELEQLGRLDGRAADELFVDLMTEHHVGGIEMAEYAVANGANDEVEQMAESMASAQRAEIAEMLAVLE